MGTGRPTSSGVPSTRAVRSTLIVTGVDPGGRFTGIVTTSGNAVLSACVIRRTTGDKFPDSIYLNEVLAEIHAHEEEFEALALEGIVEPRGRNPDGEQMIMSAAGLIGTGMVYGAVLALWPDAVVVEPGGNGSLPDAAYPLEIQRGKRLGGPSDHARSAYDVALAGEVLYRMRPRTGGRT